MGQPVALPKFELPGDKPHWAVRAAWIVGGLLLLSIGALTGAVLYHKSAQTNADLAKAEAIERIKAEADAKVAAVAAAAKATKEAELAAKAAAKQAALATNTVGARAGDDDETGGPAAKVKKRRAGRTVGAGRTLAKGGAAAAPKGPKKPDAIDELLSKMDKK
jgi:hypothetical protein